MRLRPLLLLALTVPLCAHAERYRVDLALFLDHGGYSTELPKAFTPPDLSRALEPEPAALAGSAIELIPETAFGLPEIWARLRNSRRYQTITRLSWIQTDPTADRAQPLHVHWGPALPYTPTAPDATAAPLTSIVPSAPAVAPLPPQTIDGTIALRLSRYLFLDADLVYTQAQPDGKLASFRLKEVRKMKRDELHYLDSPRLGIVARVTKAPATTTPTTQDLTPQPSPVPH